MKKKVKSKEIVWDRQLLNCIKYKWEFLRRNEKYKLDYKRFMEDKTRNYKLYEYTRWRRYFIFRYGVYGPVDPKKDFLISKGIGTVQYFLTSLTNDAVQVLDGDNVLLNDYRGCPSWSGGFHYDKKDAKYLNFRVNLNSSNERILFQFKKILSSYREMVKERLGEDLTQKDKRMQIKIYKDYLRVFDYKQKKKCDMSMLASVFCENDFKRDPEYGRRKVKRKYDACVNLIEGGYRQIE